MGDSLLDRQKVVEQSSRIYNLPVSLTTLKRYRIAWRVDLACYLLQGYTHIPWSGVVRSKPPCIATL